MRRMRSGTKKVLAGIVVFAVVAAGWAWADRRSEGTSLTISGANFTESQVMASIYEQLLEEHGYDVTIKLVDARPIYMSELSNGGVDLVPDYLAGIGDYLNTEANGPEAKPITSNSPEKSVRAIQPLAKSDGITILTPSVANNPNSYAVTRSFAKKHDLKTLSDLGKVSEKIILAAAPDCEERVDCAAGLRDTYGINISKVVPLGFGTPQTKREVTSGKAQLALVSATDATLADDGLVILKDDRGLQPAQNLTPAVNSDYLDEHPDIAELLDDLSAKLTTDELAKLNIRIDRDRELPDDIAHDFLVDVGLI